MHDFDLTPDVRELDRDHCVADVLLEPGRVDRRGHSTDVSSTSPGRPLRHVEFDWRAINLHAHELALRSLFLDSLKGGFADEVLRLLQVDGPAEADLIRVVFDRHVGAVVQDPRLDAPDIGGTCWPNAVRLAGLDHRVPEIPSAGRVEEIQFVPDLSGPSGAGHEERDAVQFRGREKVVGKVRDLLAEQVTHQRFRLGTLHLERRGIRFRDRHVQARAAGDPFGPKKDVAVREGDPEPVLLEAEQNGIVQDAPGLVRDEHILSLAHPALPHVPGCEELHELEPVRAADLHISLDGDVPEGDLLEQVPVFLHRIVVIARQERVIVHRVGLATRLQGRIEEGRSSEACPALDQGHVVRPRSRALSAGPWFLCCHVILSEIEMPRSRTPPTSNSWPTRWFNGAPRVVTFRRVAPAGIVIWLSLAMASMASDSMSVTSRPGPGRSEYVPLSRKYRSPSSPFPGTARTWSTERTRASALSAM